MQQSAVTQVLNQITAYLWADSMQFVAIFGPISVVLWLLVLFLWLRKKKNGKNRKK